MSFVGVCTEQTCILISEEQSLQASLCRTFYLYQKMSYFYDLDIAFGLIAISILFLINCAA